MPVVYPQIRTSADFLQSTIRINQLIPFLKQQKAEACAIVNSRLYGLLPFLSAMKEANIHSVIGLYSMIEIDENKVLPLILYAKNNQGYQNLLKITSAQSIRAEDALPLRWLQSYKEGCIAIIPLYAEKGKWFEEEEIANQLKTMFGEDLLIGVEAQLTTDWQNKAMRYSERCQLPLMALSESCYIMPEDFFSYDVATRILTGTKLDEPNPIERKNRNYLFTEEKWNELFEGHHEWLAKTKEVLFSCKVNIEHKHAHMPTFPLPEGEQSGEIYLKKLVLKGLHERLGTNIPERYIERAKYELDIIISMNYADYFLIVQDFLNFARQNQIIVGPGRGSSASSLVAYALKITEVDPLKFDLLFERFLNPHRISLPDIDIDFVDIRRDEVIRYVAEKYGKNHVAQIITYGTLSAKAVARDVARIFNFDTSALEMISKLIPNRPGITLEEAYQSSEKLRAWIEAEEIRKKWFQTAMKLEGLPRNASTHAAGVVLCPEPIVEVAPIEMGHDDIFLTQWPMQEVEKSGLLKMDFLGLRNLTIIEQILRSIYRSEGVWIDLYALPLDDARTYALLRSGDTTGIFQLESEGMRQALQEINPTHFLDIVAVNALYRPGPMDFIPLYARRKANKEPVIVPHRDLLPILGETYGIIVYQEQIMRIANVLAGFSIGEADLLRRAISKKNRELLEENEVKFVAGAKKKGYNEHVAKEVYDLIVRFADYGFAKSHAVAYSHISYYMAFLKANFPLHFYAALMTNASGNQEKLSSIVQEAKLKGIEILPPSIFTSSRYFKVEGGKIRFSLSAIKGVSQNVLQEIATLEKQPNEDFFDIAVRLRSKVFTRKNIEPLIKAGAFDDLNIDRAVLLASLDVAAERAKLNDEISKDDQLFTDHKAIFGKPKLIKVNPIPVKEKLSFEKEVLGFYLSDHPVTLARKKQGVKVPYIYELTKVPDNQFVKCIGQIASVRTTRTKKGEQMAFVLIEDETSQLSATFFPAQFQSALNYIKEDAIIYVEGYLERRYGKLQVKVKHSSVLSQ